MLNLKQIVEELVGTLAIKNEFDMYKDQLIYKYIWYWNPNAVYMCEMNIFFTQKQGVVH